MFFKKSRRRRNRKRYTRKVGGRYQQYLSNVPYSPTYSLAGGSPYANPPPLNASMTCQDNYNHYTKTSFRS